MPGKDYQSTRNISRKHSEQEEHEDDEEMGWSFRRKFFTVIVVIIIIIAAIAGIFLMNPAVDQIVISPPLELEDGTGITIEAHALLKGSGSADGTGDIEIYYNGEEQYHSRLKFVTDRAVKEIKYEDFVIEPGEYEIKVGFGDKSNSYLFNTNEFNFGIAEYFNVTMTIEPSALELQSNPSKRSEQIKIHTLAFVRDRILSNGKYIEKNPTTPPRYSTVELTIEHESGASETYTKDLINTNDLKTKTTTLTFDDFIYYDSGTGPGPGNYTVSLKVTNHYLKKTSPKYQIELTDLRRQFLNIAPIADAGLDIEETAARGTASIEIEFDASNCWNDGKITKYIWDFNYDEFQGFQPDAETTSPQITHTYYKSQSSKDRYEVVLIIEGDVTDPTVFDIDIDNPTIEISVEDDLVVTIHWSLL